MRSFSIHPVERSLIGKALNPESLALLRFALGVTGALA
jgi:hypothetical protein